VAADEGLLSSAPTSPPGSVPARAPAGPKGERPPRICNVATKCVSREDFLRSFAAFVDDTTLFIPTKLAFELGQLVRFQVSLADGTVVLAGIGEASELLTGPTGPLGKSGVRFLIKEVDEPSRTVRDELAARRRKAVAAGVAPPTPAPADPAPFAKTMQGLAPGGPPAAARPAAPRPQPAAATPPPVNMPAPRPHLPPAIVLQDPRLEARPEPPAETPVPPQPRLDAFAQPGLEPTLDQHPPMRPEPQPMGSLNLPRPEHDPFNEATLSAATDPLDNEHTRQDLKAEAMGRLATESDLGSTRAPRFGHAPPGPPPVPGAAFEDDPEALAELRPGRLRRFAPIVLGAAAALLIAFLLWMRLTRPGQPSAPAAETVAAAEPAPEPVAAPAAAPVAAAPKAPQPPQPSAEPLPPPEPPPPEPVVRAKPVEPPAPPSKPAANPTGPRKCQARIDSKPRGATVTLGQLTLGRTPIARTAVPCGAASVTIAHARYVPATVALDAAPNAPVSVSARLSRPVAQLRLASSPDGAVFKVNGDRVGRGSRNVTVSRFETVRVEARLPGKRPWVRKIYLRDSVTEVMATFNH
jgi:hypothetical protein